MVDASILEKLRLASQQHRKKTVTRTDSLGYGFSQQCDSQTIPSTQPCTVASTQGTKNRITNATTLSQCDFSQSSFKQFNSVQRHQQPLMFDAYCQVVESSNDRSKLQLVMSERYTIMAQTSNGNTAEVQCELCPKNPVICQEDLQNILDLFITPLAHKCDVILETISGSAAKAPNATIPARNKNEDDELLYLSFLFDHDQDVTIRLFDAPLVLKEVSILPISPIKSLPLRRVSTRQQSRKRSQPTAEDVDVPPPTSLDPPTDLCLKRARLTVYNN